jgi:hypothetical protein
MRPVTPRRCLPCPACNAARDHDLLPTKEGAAWTCTECAGVTRAFTHREMAEYVAAFFRELPFEAPSKKYQGSLEGIRVTVRLRPDWDPVEAHPDMLREHVEITGDLPVAGKPLYHALPGMPSSLLTLQFGIVETISTHEEHPVP